MDNQKKPSQFGLWLLIGSIIGAISAFFLSPKSGVENREEARELYLKARKWLVEELAELKEKVGEIDKEKYINAVEKVVKKVQKEVKHDAKQMEKLKRQLMKEWEKMEK